MSKTGRFVLALFVSPLAVFPAILVSMLLISILSRSQPTGIENFLSSALILTFYGSIVAFVFLLVAGLPTFLLLVWLRLGYALPVAIAGAVLGMAFGFGTAGFGWFGVIATTCGAAVAASFCRIVNGSWGAPAAVRKAAL